MKDFTLVFSKGDGKMFSEVRAMFMQFRVKNYRSIGDELVLDFTAGKGREHSDFLVEKNGVKILPVISMYGSNASGKTTVIDALNKMIENIVNSHRLGEMFGRNLTTPFLYNDAYKMQSTEMEMFIALDGREYQYGYVVTREKVIEEWLLFRKLSVNETKSHVVFERFEDEIKFANKFKNLEPYKGMVGDKTLVLSFLGNQKSKNHIKNLQVFNDIYTWAYSNIYFDFSILPIELWYGLYLKTEGSISSFLKFLNEFDPCIEDIRIAEEKNSDGEAKYRVFTKHNGEEYPLEIESQGTQKLFKIYFSVFGCIHLKRSIFICDELDTHLHPLIIRRIVRMFHDKEINKMGSQLIFSSHNLIILDNKELRRDEIWFIEKNDNGFTTAYSLDSFKTTDNDIRSDMSYGKHYLAGRFGAVPNVGVKRGM